MGHGGIDDVDELEETFQPGMDREERLGVKTGISMIRARKGVQPGMEACPNQRGFTEVRAPVVWHLSSCGRLPCVECRHQLSRASAIAFARSRHQSSLDW
jgi:hypothetical protein